ncbi:MAG: NAD(P)/FAD-dependent oxidoreductase [Phycisphaerales bacterium]
MLARCRRDVLLIDSGVPRNRHAREIHNFLTRDCTPPAAFRDEALRDLARYGVAPVRGEAHGARLNADGTFTVLFKTTDGERTATGRKLLLATGMRDVLPAIEGIDRFYGSTVHHCPYCDGYEHRDKRLVAFGAGDRAVGLALALHTWSRSLTACTEGEPVRDELLARAALCGIAVRTDRVTSLRGDGDRLSRVDFDNGPPLECDALFFNTGQVQRSDLPRRLGCRFKDDGGVETSDRMCSGVKGLYVAGDADREVEFVVVAAAQGATAAVAINGELQREETGG